ncbi:MAG: cobaltochelatase subunit CobN [Chloroherpetonaceae bacterium]|nr:cobaltochelatase subunit CobN [Chloroherpetonaceae bacterium]
MARNTSRIFANFSAGKPNISAKLGIDEKHAPRVGLLFFRKHLLQERTYIDDIIRAFERKGFYTLPVFVMGVEAHIAVREWLSKAHLDFLVNTMGFGLVGGPAGSTKPGSQTKIAEELLRKLNVAIYRLASTCNAGLQPVGQSGRLANASNRYLLNSRNGWCCRSRRSWRPF